MTHDHTTKPDAERQEVWADVKSPGDGRTYSVGTIEVETVSDDPMVYEFSGEGVDLPPPPSGSFASASPRRQVVVLQCADAVQGIVWQRLFYGDSTSSLGFTLRTAGTNARGIAVWPAEEDEDTRIAICGESYDKILPLSQTGSSEIPAWSANDPTGFIAVYDGAGTLLWTHHFFGSEEDADCAITDVAIRVETRGEDTFDVVTYCGMSTHGVPGSVSPASSLIPVLPFAALSVSGCTNAGGNANHGTGQWDGIVGRLVRDQEGTTTTQEFHSIVGGVEQDALFGIAEADKDRFYVVGTTVKTTSSSSSAAFPFSGTCFSAIGDYCVGAMLVFDASATVASPVGNLQLLHSLPLGTAAEGVATCARDVAVVLDAVDGVAIVHVVGSTDDEDFQTSFGITGLTGIQNTPGGGVDGFLVTAVDTQPAFNVYHAGWYGGSWHDGLTGVSAWSEFPDHLAFAGFVDRSGSDSEIVYASVFSDLVATTPSQRYVRQGNIGGSGVERTAVMGLRNAITFGDAYDERDLGSHAGGGAAVDHRARLHVVGSTGSSNLPESPSTWPFPGRKSAGGEDGVRLALDMLPIGVWRTDGTGTDVSGVPVAQPGSGIDGGTTPVACRHPFGIRILGSGLDLPPAKRILLDYDGAAPAQSETPIVLIDQPHWDTNTNLLGAVIDLSILATPTPYLGMETWLNPSTATTYFLTWTGGTHEWQLSALPASPFDFSLQVFCLLDNSLNCGGSSFSTIASPALTVEY